MTATELIEQFKTLPAQEQAVVVEFVQHLGTANGGGKAPDVRSMDEATFEAASERVLDRHAELFKKLAL